jgi:succinoglycan biosynthesis protein ExoO
MSQAPDISIIITTYKVPHYIARAVNSALSQTGVNVEVTIVDDCSPDTTWDVIQTLKDPRITAIRMEQNGGPSATRNRAIAAAKGRWLAVLDGDDVFLEGRLARMLALGEAKQADIVVDNLLAQREVDGAEFPMFTSERLESMPIITAEAFIAGNNDFINGGYGLGYMKPLFRADFLKAKGLSYRESIRIGEDYVLMMEALASGATCVVDAQAGYGYTVRAGSISHRLSPPDVARIQAEDERFLAHYTLDDAAMKQQRIREKNLVEALAYNQMVDAIKEKNMGALVRIAKANPLATRHLLLPVKVRVARLKKRLGL